MNIMMDPHFNEAKSGSVCARKSPPCSDNPLHFVTVKRLVTKVWNTFLPNSNYSRLSRGKQMYNSYLVITFQREKIPIVFDNLQHTIPMCLLKFNLLSRVNPKNSPFGKI